MSALDKIIDQAKSVQVTLDEKNKIIAHLKTHMREIKNDQDYGGKLRGEVKRQGGMIDGLNHKIAAEQAENQLLRQQLYQIRKAMKL